MTVFACGYQDDQMDYPCYATFNNIEDVRRHVWIVHGRPPIPREQLIALGWRPPERENDAVK